MKNIFLNGLNDVAPTELNTYHINMFYFYVAPTELIISIEDHCPVWGKISVKTMYRMLVPPS